MGNQDPERGKSPEVTKEKKTYSSGEAEEGTLKSIWGLWTVNRTVKEFINRLEFNGDDIEDETLELRELLVE